MTVTINGTDGVTLDNGAADGAQVSLASSGYSNWNLDNYSGRFRAYYGASEKFTIDTSGNVGIGTIPYEKLQVSGNILVGDGTNANYIELRNASNWTGRLAASAVGNFSQQYYNGSAWVNGTTLDSSGNFKINSGYGSVATAYGCRAWVNFNGTGTVAIRASGNVSSITDIGVGNYAVNFTTAMPDANYSCTGSGDTSVRTNNGAAPTTTAVSVQGFTSAGALVDGTYFSVKVTR